jgi:hypothetical protein
MERIGVKNKTTLKDEGEIQNLVQVHLYSWRKEKGID